MNSKKWTAYYETKDWAETYLANVESARAEFGEICGKLAMISYVENYPSNIPQMVGKAKAIAHVLGLSTWAVSVAN